MSTRRLQNAIDSPTLELKIISAGDLSLIDATDKLDAYAVVSMNGDTNQKKQSAKTPIDYDGGSHPTWNHTVKFSINEKAAREGLLTVQVKLYSYWLESENDLYLGEVNVSVQDLLASNPLSPFANGNVKKMKPMTYPVKFIGETKQNAKLSLSYRFKPVPVDDLYPPQQPESDYLPPFGQPLCPSPYPASQPIIYSPQFQPTGRTTTVMKLALELVVQSAKNIRNVNVFDDMDVYASVSIHEGKTSSVKHKTKTPIAYSGFKFPVWNHAVKFSLDEEELGGENRFNLVVELKSHRPVMGDKHIGEVRVRIQELISLNPPSPLFDAEPSRMMLVTLKVTGPTGEQGTLNFTYRFLKEQVTIPIVPDVVPQQFIMYIPVPHQSYGSANPVHGTSGYMSVHPAGNVEPSNGLVPIYMQPPYQPQPQPQLPLQNFQSQQQSQHQPQLQLPPQNIQSQPQPQHQPQWQPPPLPPPPQQPTQLQAQEQGGRPQGKPQKASTVAALGQGAAILGKVIGGTLLSTMMSDGGNMQEVESSGLSFLSCDQALV